MAITWESCRIQGRAYVRIFWNLAVLWPIVWLPLSHHPDMKYMEVCMTSVYFKRYAHPNYIACGNPHPATCTQVNLGIQIRACLGAKGLAWWILRFSFQKWLPQEKNVFHSSQSLLSEFAVGKLVLACLRNIWKWMMKVAGVTRNIV